MSDAPKSNLPQILPAGGQVIAVVPQSVEEIFRLAKGIVQSGLAPSALTGYLKATATDEQITKAVSAVAIVIMAGAELGLPPMVSLRSFTAINGRPALYGDGLINVVRRSGRAKRVEVGYTRGKDYRLFIRAGRIPKPETPEEEAEAKADFLSWPEDERTGGFCEAERNDTGESKTVVFTVAEAKRAGLWQTEAKIVKEVWEEDQAGKRRPIKKEVPNDSPWFRYRERMCGWRAAGYDLRELFGDVLGGITDDWEAREIAGMVDVTPASRPTPPSPPEPPEPGNEPDPNAPPDQTGGGGKPQPASAAEDFNDDASDLSTPALNTEAYLARLDEELGGMETEDELIAKFEELGVDTELADNPAIERAYAVRERHLSRINGQGDLLAPEPKERPFPGDEELPPATARALRNARPS